MQMKKLVKFKENFFEIWKTQTAHCYRLELYYKEIAMKFIKKTLEKGVGFVLDQENVN